MQVRAALCLTFLGTLLALSKDNIAIANPSTGIDPREARRSRSGFPSPHHSQGTYRSTSSVPKTTMSGPNSMRHSEDDDFPLINPHGGSYGNNPSIIDGISPNARYGPSPQNDSGSGLIGSFHAGHSEKHAFHGAPLEGRGSSVHGSAHSDIASMSGLDPGHCVPSNHPERKDYDQHHSDGAISSMT